VRIYVTGLTGLVGRELGAALAAAGHAVVGEPRRPDTGERLIDVRSGAAVARAIAEAEPDWVVHLAAYTRVDDAERQPREAEAVNAGGTANVARAARALGARLLVMSTDYVFDGRRPHRTPYVETDPTGPRSVYGRTKLEGERRAAAIVPDCLIVRSSWLYGARQGFVDAILDLAASRPPVQVVSDEEGSPTYAPDLAAALVALLEAGASGPVHAANAGGVTRLELARTALRLAGDDPAKVVPTTQKAFGRAAPRPEFSVLDCTRCAALTGRALRPWEAALAEHVALRRAHEVTR
jgi:dTDP-4-dehydrorhamnose reductase